MAKTNASTTPTVRMVREPVATGDPRPVCAGRAATASLVSSVGTAERIWTCSAAGIMSVEVLRSCAHLLRLDGPAGLQRLW